jgi:type II secretory pathway pseudopilin PulG
MVESTPRKANPLEIIGAWLHLWVPPRDAVVPPIPWKKIAIGTGIGAVIVGVALAILVPRIDTSKEESAARKAAEKRAAVAQNRARINRSQTPHQGDASSLLPAAGASAAEVAAAKGQLMERMKADLLADARKRAAAGEMRPVTGAPTCNRTLGTPTSGPIAVFDCFLPTGEMSRTARTAQAAIGYPFRTVVDYKTFTYTWCKTEQVPGEMLVLSPKDVTLLPPACRGPKS